jgi:hypothetical protein
MWPTQNQCGKLKAKEKVKRVSRKGKEEAKNVIQ